MCGGAWGTAGKITRCRSGLLELFVAAASRRVISQILSVAVEQEADGPSIKALRLIRFSPRVIRISSLSQEDGKGTVGSILVFIKQGEKMLEDDGCVRPCG